MGHSPAQTLARIGRLLAETRGPEQALSLLVDVAVETLRADAAAALRVTETGSLAVVAARNLPDAIDRWSTEAELVGPELGEQLRRACGPGFAYVEVLPLVADGNVYGVLVLLARSPRGLEGERLEVAEGLVDLTAVAIEKAVQYAKLEQAYAELERSRAAIVREASERQRAEEALRREQKLALERERLADIGAVTAKIAHDLGNPLSGLSMQAQLILQRARREPSLPLSAVTKPAEQLTSEVRRLEALIRELLAFAREQRLELETFDVRKLLQEIADLWRPVAAEHRIVIETEIRDAASPLEGDVGKLHRVLDNLVKNAVEAIGEGPGEVRLVVSKLQPERIRISVEDTGPGISETVQLFRLFETTKEHGTGLGLAISKQIMLAHGGDLLFARGEPRGTIFHAELPVRRG